MDSPESQWSFKASLIPEKKGTYLFKLSKWLGASVQFSGQSLNNWMIIL